MIQKILNLFKAISTTSSITARELHNKLQEKKSSDEIILDVRTKEEFLGGHISNAIHIDVRSRDFGQKIQELDKSKTYFVYCRSGMRSLMACKAMSKAGFEKPVNVKGGFLSWMNIK